MRRLRLSLPPPLLLGLLSSPLLPPQSACVALERAGREVERYECGEILGKEWWVSGCGRAATGGAVGLRPAVAARTRRQESGHLRSVSLWGCGLLLGRVAWGLLHILLAGFYWNRRRERARRGGRGYGRQAKWPAHRTASHALMHAAGLVVVARETERNGWVGMRSSFLFFRCYTLRAVAVV